MYLHLRFPPSVNETLYCSEDFSIVLIIQPFPCFLKQPQQAVRSCTEYLLPVLQQTLFFHFVSLQVSFLSMQAASSQKMAGYIRREQEWTLQANLAVKESIQLDKKI